MRVVRSNSLNRMHGERSGEAFAYAGMGSKPVACNLLFISPGVPADASPKVEETMRGIQGRKVIIIGAVDGIPAEAARRAVEACGGEIIFMANQFFV